MMNLYTYCCTCTEKIDASIPRQFCPFCNTPIPERPSALVPLVVGVGYFVVQAAGPAFVHDKGALVPKDLPHEQIDMPHSIGHSTAISSSGWGQFSTITNVTTTASSGIEGAVSPIFLNWTKP